jgi:hypothetical protein
MATRARGANAQLALAYESVYGTSPSSGFYKVPFVSSQIGDEQKLISSDLLGGGRDPYAPSLDVVTNEGDIVVPVDLRNFGLWLKLLLGAPTTTAGIAATGTIAFSAQPITASTIGVGGTAFTFGTDIVIGSTLKDTLTNAVMALNASTAAAVAVATYGLNTKGDTIEIVYDTVGTAGNSFALAASTDPASNATVSGATLTGGAATGAYNHVFTSGLMTLPSASVEVGMTDTANYAMNYGLSADKLAIGLARSGLLNATISCIAQGEATRTVASAAGTLSTLAFERFTQFSGSVSRQGVPIGDLVSGNFNYANNMDKVEVIRDDGRIAGVDPSVSASTGQAVLRFKDMTLLDLAANGTPIDLTHKWKISAVKTLTVVNHEVYLPKPKTPITGPAGVQATYDWQSSKNEAAGNMLTVTLVNDVESY